MLDDYIDKGTLCDRIPYSHVLIEGFGENQTTRFPCLALFDSGSTFAWTRKAAIPNGVEWRIDPKPIIGAALAGNFESNEYATLNNISVPEFSPTRTVRAIPARVMETEWTYDITFGRDFCTMYGIVMDFEEQIMELKVEGIAVPMRHTLPKERNELPASRILERDNDDSERMQEYESKSFNENLAFVNDDLIHTGYKSKTFNETLSNQADLETLISSQGHLTEAQQEELLKALQQCPTLFDGKLGKFTQYEVGLELKSDAVPKASRPHPVPRTHLVAFKARLDRLVELDVFEPAD